jgi:hypothetical protein
MADIMKEKRMTQDEAIKFMKSEMVSVWLNDLVDVAHMDDGDDKQERIDDSETELVKVAIATTFDEVKDLYYDYLIDGNRSYDVLEWVLGLFVKT